MTQLRVFQDLKERVWVEVTSPKAKMTRSLFVRGYWNEAIGAIPLNSDECVVADLKGEKLIVGFLLVTSRRRESCAKLKPLGLLEENPSRDILNNILDILGYD
jgi:hypothetical protein